MSMHPVSDTSGHAVWVKFAGGVFLYRRRFDALYCPNRFPRNESFYLPTAERTAKNGQFVRYSARPMASFNERSLVDLDIVCGDLKDVLSGLRAEAKKALILRGVSRYLDPDRLVRPLDLQPNLSFGDCQLTTSIEFGLVEDATSGLSM
jgi:hypothetical protein